MNNVKSVLLLNPRKKATQSELRDQYWRGDPYGYDSILPDTEVRNYLRYLDVNDLPVIRRTSRPGYRFVETRERKGVYRRFDLSKDGKNVISVAIENPRSRYAVTWSDISTNEDRRFWVAGGRLKVIERATGNILGERIGYLIEPEFGSQRGGRRPWLHARLTSSERAACPAFPSKGFWPINRLFVEKILRPVKEGLGGQ